MKYFIFTILFSIGCFAGFYRIENEMYSDQEEVRSDLAATKANAIDYVCVALSGAVESDAAWSCVRTEYGASATIIRKRFRSGMKYSERTLGW